MKATTRTLQATIALLGSLWLVPALADVALSTTVQKIERVTAEDGTVKTRFVAPEKVVPGDEMHYEIIFKNAGDAAVDAGTVVITNPIPENTVYLADSAFGAGTQIVYSVDGTEHFAAPDKLTVVREGVQVPATSADYTAIRWTFGPALAAGAQGHVSFNVRLK